MKFNENGQKTHMYGMQNSLRYSTIFFLFTTERNNFIETESAKDRISQTYFF